MKGLRSYCMIATACWLIAGCGGGGGGVVDGNLLVIANFQTATRSIPGYADTVRVTIVPPSGVVLPGTFPNPFFLTRTSASRKMTVDPSLQPYTVSMVALTNGVVVGTASSSATVIGGQLRVVDVSTNIQSKIDSVSIGGQLSANFLGTTQLTAQAKDDQGQTLFTGPGFSWSSSDPSVASINGTGLIETWKEGSTTITATLTGTP